MSVDTIGVYWKARRESAEECTVRLRKFFIELARDFPFLADWYALASTKKDAMASTEVNQFDEHTLLTLVEKGRNKKDIGGTYASLGFRVALWNQGKYGIEADMDIKCGLYHENPNLTNCVYIGGISDLSKVGLDTLGSQEKLLLLMASAWDADWGAIYKTSGNAIRNRVGNGPFLDTMLWMKKRQNESPFDESVNVKNLSNGVLYIR